MNAILRSSGIKDKKGTTESESCGSRLLGLDLATDSKSQTVIAEYQLTPANQAAKLMLLSLLARYD